MARPEYSPALPLSEKRQLMYIQPGVGFSEDINKIYIQNNIKVGVSNPSNLITTVDADPRLKGITGAQLGDEGKGKLTDALTEEMLTTPHIDSVDVIRFNGGNNAGHTIEANGKKLALHVIPSGVMHERTIGIMDTGMAINAEDLRTEVTYVEDVVGDLRGKLLLSERASLNTDLERAEEAFNNNKSLASKGGTKRGISPTYAHRLDRTGSTIRDLLASDWDTKLGERYDNYDRTFAAFGIELSEVEVPDFEASVASKKAVVRTVGSKNDFLTRLGLAREWLIQSNIVTNTILHHEQSFQNSQKGVIFEGAQAYGLDPSLGTWPDVTSSPTTFLGINTGTGFYTKDQVEKRLAIVKHNPSSVGERRMPTHIDLPRLTNELGPDATEEQKYYAWVRHVANERGTTTGRWRDMNYLDLPFLTYNLFQGGANELGITHMDISQEGIQHKIAFSYRTKTGESTRYQPDLAYLNEIEPETFEVPGWDGEKAAKATTFDELPENAQKFAALIQERTGIPVVVFTNGPARNHIIKVQGF